MTLLLNFKLITSRSGANFLRRGAQFTIPTSLSVRTFANAAPQAVASQSQLFTPFPAPPLDALPASGTRHVRLIDVPAGQLCLCDVAYVRPGLKVVIGTPESFAGKQTVTVTGPQGTCNHYIHHTGLRAELIQGKQLRLTRFLEDAPIQTHETVLRNLIWGALTPYRRTLTLKGVGFGVRKVEEKEGHGKGAIELKVGFRKPVIFKRTRMFHFLFSPQLACCSQRRKAST